ncbi:MAG: ribulose-phosphate 3-epimerase [Anaerolineae bacterium]|nr:ribulose-phosphate 3-epimerase [Anaerolineae bacterium]
MTNPLNLSTTHLLMDLSLWSADLTNLAGDIRRTEPFADLYHLDVADSHFVPSLLFFPDLVAALRPLTTKPFHVHFMVTNPTKLIPDFVQAGANIITVHLENAEHEQAIAMIRAAGLQVGLAVQIETPVEQAVNYFDRVNFIVLMGTKLGIKGVGLDENACARIRTLRRLLREQGYGERIMIAADGGIRDNTVPDLRAAGCDIITPGSLVFKSPNLFETTNWIHSLPKAVD